jgi:hypothetical protein
MDMKKKMFGALLATALAAPMAAQAIPVLIGDTVTISLGSPSFGPVTTDAVVSAGNEWTVGNALGYTTDVGDDYVRFTVNSNFCGFVCGTDIWTLTVSGMDFTPFASIIGVSLFDGGLGAFNPTFTANSISFQMPDQAQTAGQFALLRFRAVAASEPATLALFGLGMLGLALGRRRAA